MAFIEDLSVFFTDFNDEVKSGNSMYKGILEQPDEIVADGVVLTTDYQLTGKTSELGTLVYGSIITVNGEDFSIRSSKKIDDGSICILSLTKS
tara:strand:+ start:596 stop:874 length:279 start_codon:yes stop_codon:yes gene_type:complete